MNTADRCHWGNVCDYGKCLKISLILSDLKSAIMAETVINIGPCTHIMYLNYRTNCSQFIHWWNYFKLSNQNTKHLTAICHVPVEGCFSCHIIPNTDSTYRLLSSLAGAKVGAFWCHTQRGMVDERSCNWNVFCHISLDFLVNDKCTKFEQLHQMTLCCNLSAYL